MNTKFLSLLASALSAAALHAGPRTSASYSIPTDTIDAGGTRTVSTSYRNDGSLGGITGISTVASPAQTAKAGYIAQLYDIIGLTLTASSLNVNETATDQLAAWQALDDGTFLAVPTNTVTWSVASGPLTSVNANGLATAGLVFKDTAATAQGTFLGQTGMLGLTVKNVNIDDYGAYAGDGLDDNWQVRFFGLPPNANAGPLVDPDHDGHDNAFEYTAGLDPTDPLSKFNWRIENVPGFPLEKKLIFSPRFNDRIYTIKATPTLGTGAVWSTLTGTATDLGNERTVTDASATGETKFYKLEINKP
ncbi:MAG: hypothetical protein ABIP85_21900 [Chthoniobacteraceae bacterium]